MKSDGDIQSLEKERNQETTRLRTRITAIADTLEHEASPAQWVRKHPFLATSGAALAGFAAAHVPLGRITGAVRPKAKATPAPVRASPLATLPWAEILELAAGAAQRYFMPSPGPTEESAASVAVADAGVVSGETFPISAFQPQAAASSP